MNDITINNIKKSIQVRGLLTSVVILLLSLFVSCNGVMNQPTSQFDILEVSFAPEEVEEKTLLQAEVDTKTAYYSYYAEPLFEFSSGGVIHGGTNGKEVQLGKTGKESAGRFTQGKWYFHIYAYNAKGSLIRDGETEIYLKKTAEGNLKVSVPITLRRTELRTGSVHFAISTVSVNSTAPYVRVTPVRQGEKMPVRTFYAKSVNPDNTATFDFSVTGLQSGMWEFIVELYDNDIRLGGGAVSTYILGGDTTQISGTVYASQWIDAGFAIVMPTPVEGTIGTAVDMGIGEHTFTWSPSSSIPANYKWYVDGVLKKDGNFKDFTHNFTKPGVFAVTCVATDREGLEMGYSSVKVTVTSASTGKFSWTTTIAKAGEVYTYKLPTQISGKPLIRVHMELGSGVIVYSGYLTNLVGAGQSWSGSFKYKDSDKEETITIALKNDQCQLRGTAPFEGVITIGGSL